MMYSLLILLHIDHLTLKGIINKSISFMRYTDGMFPFRGTEVTVGDTVCTVSTCTDTEVVCTADIVNSGAKTVAIRSTFGWLSIPAPHNSLTFDYTVRLIHDYVSIYRKSFYRGIRFTEVRLFPQSSL